MQSSKLSQAQALKNASLPLSAVPGVGKAERQTKIGDSQIGNRIDRASQATDWRRAADRWGGAGRAKVPTERFLGIYQFD